MRAILLYFSLILSACAVELVMRAHDKPTYNPDPAEAAAGQSVAGMIIDIMPDGQVHGSGICQPNYIVVKLPGVSRDRVEKYLSAEYGTNGLPVRYREWQYKITNLTTLQRRIFTNSSITVRATGGDLTWDRFKTNFWNLRTGLTETNDL